MFDLPIIAALQAFVAEDCFLGAVCRPVERILAAFAAFYLVRAGVRFCRDQYSWWRITAPWWPRSRSYVPNDKQTFQYQALPRNSIRLFMLEPDSGDDSIRGQLINVPLLVSSGRYEALSYTWGNPSNKRFIEINGCPFGVTQNLFEALQHFHREGGIPSLWIDAICINQQDSQERSAQVRLMADIYRNAGNVQIWLGRENEATAAGMQVLSFLAEGEDNASETPLTPWIHSGFSDREVEGLKDIFDRPYFNRLWVVQEIALSRRASLNVGHLHFSWDHSSSLRFLKRLKFIEITPQWRDRVKIDMTKLSELLEQGLRVENAYRETPDLLDIIHEIRHRKSVDARDRIYSAISLAKDGQEFQVDYLLSVEETFENLYHYIRLKYKDRWAKKR